MIFLGSCAAAESLPSAVTGVTLSVPFGFVVADFPFV